jgi:transposase-like protein/IS1 family transposase
MLCPLCNGETRKFGKNRNGSQRFRCDACSKCFTDDLTRPEDRRRRHDPATMILALRLLLEGNSVRSVERITKIHRNLIIDAMVDAGEKCTAWMEEKIIGVPVEDVQADELWQFIACKEKTAMRKGYGPEVGDSWTFVAIERTSKLIVAWHLGKPDPYHTHVFAEKLRDATSGRFQLTTDGFRAYLSAMPAALGGRIDYATLTKVYGPSEDDRRYSPPQVIDIIQTVQTGAPEEARICTSHIERSNKTIRMQLRRFTRLTDGHSKKWENHNAAIGLFFAYYNFCRVHSTIKTTPAKAAGLASEPWSLERLLTEANRV